MPRPSSPSVKVTYFNKPLVRRYLRRFVSELVEKRPEVRRVVLFGSLARDDAVPGSDVDLIIILAASDKPFLDRISQYTPSPFPVGIEVFPYTQEELQVMLQEGNSFMQRALAEGITLFEAEEAS